MKEICFHFNKVLKWALLNNTKEWRLTWLHQDWMDMKIMAEIQMWNRTELISKPKANHNICSVMIPHEKKPKHEWLFSLWNSKFWTPSRIQLCSKSAAAIRLEAELPGGHHALAFSSLLCSIRGHVLHLPWCCKTLAGCSGSWKIFTGTQSPCAMWS